MNYFSAYAQLHSKFRQNTWNQQGFRQKSCERTQKCTFAKINNMWGEVLQPHPTL